MLAITAGQDPDTSNYIHDLQVFANKEAFDLHANMNIPELKDALMGLMANYDFSGKRGPALSGEVWAPDSEAVLNVTKSMGA